MKCYKIKQCTKIKYSLYSIHSSLYFNVAYLIENYAQIEY